MATKTNPGAFRCYEAALPDEPFFTILARDPAAPATLRFWTEERVRQNKCASKEDTDRLGEARRDAEHMAVWRAKQLAAAEETGEEVSWRLPRPKNLDDDGPICEMPLPDDPLLHAIRKVCDIRADLNDFDGDRRGIAQALCDAEEALAELAGVDQDLLFGDRLNVKMTMKVPKEAVESANTGDLDYLGEFGHQPVYVTKICPTVIREQMAERLRTPLPGNAIVDTQPDDLAHAPEVPPHRFSMFHKGELYAYARGLEINPIHLPKALDEMAKDGWNLLAIFGQTDSQHVGFIFQRYPMIASVPSIWADDDLYKGFDSRYSVISTQMKAYQEGASFEEIDKAIKPERFIIEYAELGSDGKCYRRRVPPENWPAWTDDCSDRGRGQMP